MKGVYKLKFLILFFIWVLFQHSAQGQCYPPNKNIGCTVTGRYTNAISPIFCGASDLINYSNIIYATFPKTQAWREGRDILNGDGINCFDFNKLINSDSCMSSQNISSANNLRSYLNYESNDSSTNNLQIKLDIYAPKLKVGQEGRDACTNRPVIIFGHGSGLSPLNSTNKNLSVISQYAKMGYVVVIPDYRKGWDSEGVGVYSWDNVCPDRFRNCNQDPNNPPDGYTFLESAFRNAQDFRAVHRYIHYHHDTYKIDTNKIFYLSGSSGAFAQMNAWFIDNGEWQEILSNDTADVSAFGEPSYRNLDDRIRLAGMIPMQASILGGVSYIDSNELVPIYLLHGNLDEAIPFKSGNLLEVYEYNSSEEEAEVFYIEGTKLISKRYDELNQGVLKQVVEIDAQDHGGIVYTLDEVNIFCSPAAQNAANILSFMNKIIRSQSQSSFYDKILNVTKNYCCKVDEDTDNFLSFDGTNDYVTVSNASSDYNIGTNDFTIEVQIENADNQRQAIPVWVGNRPSSDDQGFLFGFINDTSIADDGKVAFLIGSSNLLYSDGDIDMRDGSCHHITITRKNNIFKLYIDGILQNDSMTTSASLNGTNEWTLGKGANFTNLTEYSGDIHFIRFWDISKSNDEIQTLKFKDIYLSESGTNLPNLLGYWKLNECSSQTVYDISSTGKNGVLGNNSSTNQFDPTRSNDIICDVSFFALRKMPIPNNIPPEDKLNLFEKPIEIYPNPFTNQININLVNMDASNDILYFKLYNIYGQVVKLEKYNSNGTYPIDTKNLLHGIYVFELEYNGKPIQSGKVIK